MVGAGNVRGHCGPASRPETCSHREQPQISHGRRKLDRTTDWALSHPDWPVQKTAGKARLGKHMQRFPLPHRPGGWMFAWKNHGRSAGPHRWLVERFALRVVIQREIPGSWSSTFPGQHAVPQTPGGTILPLTGPSPSSMAIVGGEPSGAAPVWKHAAADGGSAAASRVGAEGTRNQSGRRRRLWEKCLRNRCEMAQIMPSRSQQTPCRARLGLWDGNGCNKIASAGKWWYIRSQPKGKMEILDE